MKRISSVLLVLTLLQPLAVFAAYSSPSALFYAIGQDPSARTSKIEVHGRAQEAWFSAWLSGEQEGIDPLTMKSSFKATVDVVYGPGKIRIKLESRTKDGLAWVRLESVEGDWGDEIFGASLNAFQKKWIQVNLSEFAMLFNEIKKAQQEPVTFFDDIFDMKQTGNHYELTLKKEIFEEMQMRAFDTEDVTAKMSIDMTSNGQFQYMKADIRAVDQDFEVTLTATTQKVASVAVTTPTDVMTMQQFIDIYPFGVFGWLATIPDFSTDFSIPPIETYEPVDDTWDDWEDWEVEDNPATPKVGTRPSARSIQEQARKQNARD